MPYASSVGRLSDVHRMHDENNIYLNINYV